MALELEASWARNQVIIGEANGLHEWVHDGRANISEPSSHHVFAHRLWFWCLHRYPLTCLVLRGNRLVIHEPPHVLVERSAFLLHLSSCADNIQMKSGANRRTLVMHWSAKNSKIQKTIEILMGNGMRKKKEQGFRMEDSNVLLPREFAWSCLRLPEFGSTLGRRDYSERLFSFQSIGPQFLHQILRKLPCKVKVPIAHLSLYLQNKSHIK